MSLLTFTITYPPDRRHPYSSTTTILPDQFVCYTSPMLVKCAHNRFRPRSTVYAVCLSSLRLIRFVFHTVSLVSQRSSVDQLLDAPKLQQSQSNCWKWNRIETHDGRQPTAMAEQWLKTIYIEYVYIYMRACVPLSGRVRFVFCNFWVCTIADSSGLSHDEIASYIYCQK